LAELAGEVGDADGAVVVMVGPQHPDTACIRGATGALAGLRGREVPTAGSLIRLVLDTGGTVAVEDARSDPRLTTVVELAPEVTGLVAAPLDMPDVASGSVLTLVRTRDGEGFAEVDRQMIGSFAAQAGAGLAAAQGRRDRERLRRLEEREGLLEQLDAGLLSRLMRLSLELTGISSRLPAGLRDAVLDRVQELDAVVRQARDTVFDL
jgi:GAF domain-containing protein